MTAPDELQRAVDRLEKAMKIADQYAAGVWFGEGNDGFVSFATILATLSERADLLATVERMREQVELQKRRVDRRDEKIDRMRAAYNCLLADTDPTSKARAALTTGEEK